MAEVERRLSLAAGSSSRWPGCHGRGGCGRRCSSPRLRGGWCDEFDNQATRGISRLSNWGNLGAKNFRSVMDDPDEISDILDFDGNPPQISK